MKKSDLKSGMVVETRNGERYMFISEMDLFINDNYGLNISSFKDDLKYKGNEENDIMTIFKPVKNGRFSEILKQSYISIWERMEVKKETLNKEQHEKLKALLTLGYNWIARDSGGDCYAYDTKPFKRVGYWSNERYEIILNTLDLPFIKWIEEEPRSIEELLKLEVVEN